MTTLTLGADRPQIQPAMPGPASAWVRRGVLVTLQALDWLQQGVRFVRAHGAEVFSLHNRGCNRSNRQFSLSPLFSTYAQAMQRELPLMGRLDAPSIAPMQLVMECKSFREAVRRCWALRRVRYMSHAQLAAEAGLYRQHVSDYLHADDKNGRRDLPGEKINAFEAVVGNTLLTQWLAAQSKLTVLEELQATKAAA